MARIKIVKLAEEHKYARQLPRPMAGPERQVEAPKVKQLKKVHKAPKVPKMPSPQKKARSAKRAARIATRTARRAKMAAAGPIKRQFLRAGGVARAAGKAIRFAGRGAVTLAAAEGAYKIGKAGVEGAKAVKAHGHLQRTRAHAREKYGVKTTQKTLLGSKLLYGLATGKTGLKVKYERRKAR